MLPAVHPIHKAGDADGDPVHGELHRGQILPRAEAQLEGDGLELGGAQLLRHVVHHGEHRFQQAAEQVLEPGGLVLQPAQLLGHVALHRLLGQSPQLLLGDLLHAPPRLAGAEHVFQHVVDEGAVLRGLEPGGLAGLGLQAVLHEVGEVTGLVLVHPGGGHGHPLSVEGVHRPAGEVPPGEPGGPLHPPHQGGIVRQSFQRRPRLGEAPRQLQGGPGGRQPEGAVQPPLLHPFRVGKQHL